MSKTIVVCGYGPGISDAVANKFGTEGFSVALVARSADKLTAAVAALEAKGIKAAAFPADLGDPKAVKAMVAKVHATLGPITVIHWNAYVGLAGDLMTASADDLRTTFDVCVTGLVAAVQEALPDLKKEKNAAVLVTGGGFAFYDPKVDAMAVQWNAMGLAVAKGAQHKLVGLLGAKLAADGVYVGEVVVLGSVKGTAFDSGHATLEASAVAAKFWGIYGERAELSVTVS
jgi:short-subunit dehydrogenase